MTYKICWRGKWATAQNGVDLDKLIREIIERGANPCDIIIEVI